MIKRMNKTTIKAKPPPAPNPVPQPQPAAPAPYAIEQNSLLFKVNISYVFYLEIVRGNQSSYFLE
jgi:hypothetical protein